MSAPDQPRPIHAITVTTGGGIEIVIPGNAFLLGAVDHNINQGTFTITLCDVVAVETDYITGRTTP